jgi:hypothetical protein
VLLNHVSPLFTDLKCQLHPTLRKNLTAELARKKTCQSGAVNLSARSASQELQTFAKSGRKSNSLLSRFFLAKRNIWNIDATQARECSIIRLKK